MSVLLLRLAGPMQAWGDSSRFVRRDTRMMPTKSGVLGLLAAADGRRRTESIEDLMGLGFGVRVDQPGSLMRDLQTAIDWETGDSMPLSYRYYVADAVFVAAVEGDTALLEALATKVREPAFPLYLGRRGCPVSGKVLIGLVDEPLREALRGAAWEASPWYQRHLPRGLVELELVADAVPGDHVLETRRDVPMSFDPERREYGWREVAHLEPAVVENTRGWTRAAGTDYLAEILEA